MYLKGIGIVSHPPVIIPEVGRGKELMAEKTVRGVRNLAMKIAEIKPETIVVITPHGNVFQDGVSVIYETRIAGNLKDFGVADVSMQKSCDMGLLDEMNRCFGEADCQSIFLNTRLAEEYEIDRSLDHGAFVPLYYVDKYYPNYKIVHITIGNLSLIELYRTGRVLREAIERNEKKTVILASADLSHALSDDGPYQSHPMGSVFDETIVQSIEKKDYYSILTMPAAVYEPAEQCGLRPMVMALGATDSIKTRSTVFSYEHPFGVGYLSAFIRFDIHQEDPVNESLIERYENDMVALHDVRLAHEDAWVRLARETIDTWVETGRKLDFRQWQQAEDAAAIEAMTVQQAGVFVSIHKAGELRGCMGTVHPVTENVAEEIIRNAIEACAYDPRFLPVEAQELYQLEISVDILGAFEYVDSPEMLDPEKYGILVEKDVRRALLLPGLTGIETGEKQLDMAKEKAGIYERDDEGERLIIQRFTTEHHSADIKM